MRCDVDGTGSRLFLLSIPLVLLSCVPSAAATGKETDAPPKNSAGSDGNPFLREVQQGEEGTGVVTLTSEEYQTFVKTKKKKHHVVTLLNVPKEREEEECPRTCRWMQKQYEALVEAYVKQRESGSLYEYDGTKIRFAQVEVSKSSKFAKDMGGVPGILLSRAKHAGGVRFGHSNLLDDAKKLTPYEKKHKELREKAAKRYRFVKKAESRAERRRKAVSTQEMREEPAYGLNDFHYPGMNNLCKWIRLRTKHVFAECPQDVDRKIASTEQKSETGKNILIAIIGASSFLYLARVFGLLLKPVDPSKEDMQRLKALAEGIKRYDDAHVMHRYTDGWWKLWTHIAAILCILMTGCCCAGMYWNFLHEQPIFGGNFRAPYSKFTGFKKQLPMQSLSTAGAVVLASFSLIALGRAATLNYWYIKLPMIFVCLFLWIGSESFLLALFMDRNRYYLQGTIMAPYLASYVGK